MARALQVFSSVYPDLVQSPPNTLLKAQLPSAGKRSTLSHLPLHLPYPQEASFRGKECHPNHLSPLLSLHRLVVGAPLETNGHQKTGDVYKCPVTQGNCTKLNLGKLFLTQVQNRVWHTPMFIVTWFISAHVTYRADR